MPYTAFNKDKPIWGADDGTTTMQHIRNNLAALRDMVVAGTMVGWPATISGGTADQPTQVLHSNGTERLRETITWGTVGGATGNPQSIVYAYSSNSGGAYDTIGTITYTYDASGNVTSWAWT